MGVLWKKNYPPIRLLLSSWVDTLYTFWDYITHYKTESVYFWGLMSSATKSVFCSGFKIHGPGLQGGSGVSRSGLLRSLCFVQRVHTGFRPIIGSLRGVGGGGVGGFNAHNKA